MIYLILMVYRHLHKADLIEVCVSSSLERKEEAFISIDETLSLANADGVKTQSSEAVNQKCSAEKLQ